MATEIHRQTVDRMRQVTQRFRSGEMVVLDVPLPQLRAGGVMIRASASVVSAGTERSKVVLAKKTLLGKAISRPDQVRKVVEQVQRDGVRAGLSKAFNKLNAFSPLGYSMAGTITAVGPGVRGVCVGDRVACGGAGFANHAEHVFVPKNLIVPVPENVSFADAAFAAVGAIALQGVRQAGVQLGERVVVVGLGLIGLITVQLLQAAGCVVLGVDPSAQRRELAESLRIPRTLGPDQLTDGTVRGITRGRGFDAAIVTAASTSEGILALAARTLRDRGRVVIVGDVPLTAPRDIFYRKELELRLSRSYGPGRYDRRYELGGHDYPIGYVRWTEQRNMEEILRLIATGSLQVQPLAQMTLPLSHAVEGYAALKEGKVLSLVLLYDSPSPPPITQTPQTATVRRAKNSEAFGLSVVGAGGYMGGVLMPCVAECSDVRLRGVLTASGLSAEDFRRRYRFDFSTASVTEVLEDGNTDAVMIATSHREHGSLVHQGLARGKFVFVEKPLAMTLRELRQIATDLKTNPRLMVGYNRRFSRHTRLLAGGFRGRGGTALLTIRVNAGFIDGEHWIQDQNEGGGRIIGELCHFVDISQYLVRSPVVSVFARGLGPFDEGRVQEDNVTVLLSHRDGSLTTIVYTAKGDPRAGKERIEMFCDGTYGEIDDFKMSVLIGVGKTRTVRGPDKGQQEEIRQWIRAVQDDSPMPISPDEAVASTLATLAIIDSLHQQQPIEVMAPWD